MVLFWMATFLFTDSVKHLRICQDFHYSLQCFCQWTILLNFCSQLSCDTQDLWHENNLFFVKLKRWYVTIQSQCCQDGETVPIILKALASLEALPASVECSSPCLIASVQKTVKSAQAARPTKKKDKIGNIYSCAKTVEKKKLCFQHS